MSVKVLTEIEVQGWVCVFVMVCMSVCVLLQRVLSLYGFTVIQQSLCFFLSLFQLQYSSSESSRTATLKEKFSQTEIVFHLEAHLKMTKSLKL